MGEVVIWDLPQGDAQDMAGVPDESFDFVHSSHCLEHLHDPAAEIQAGGRLPQSDMALTPADIYLLTGLRVGS